jgi:hypothetical protein
MDSYYDKMQKEHFVNQLMYYAPNKFRCSSKCNCIETKTICSKGKLCCQYKKLNRK